MPCLMVVWFDTVVVRKFVSKLTYQSLRVQGLVATDPITRRRRVAEVAGPSFPARQQLIRTMNEQLLLDHIRRAGQLSRADLARISSLSKPTVSGALATLERAGLVRVSGTRTGVPGPAAVLYEIRPEAGFVLGLDVGRKYLRA